MSVGPEDGWIAAERKSCAAMDRAERIEDAARAVLELLTENGDLRVPLGGRNWHRLRVAWAELAAALDAGPHPSGD